MAIASTNDNIAGETGTLVLTGSKWNVTSYISGGKTSNITIPISITSQSQSVNIRDCSGHNFHITYSGTASTSVDSISPNGKCVAIVIDNCKNCTFVIEPVIMSSIEIINSKKCKIQVGKCNVPLVSIDNSEGIVFYLIDNNNDNNKNTGTDGKKTGEKSVESILPEFVTCRATEVMIVKSSETNPEDQVEICIPEQFKTVFLEDGTVNTSPVQHTGV